MNDVKCFSSMYLQSLRTQHIPVKAMETYIYPPRF